MSPFILSTTSLPSASFHPLCTAKFSRARIVRGLILVRHHKQNRERNRLMKKRTTIVTSLSMLGVILLAAGTAAFAADDEKSAREAAAQFYKALNIMFTGGLDPMKEVWSHSDDVTY